MQFLVNTRTKEVILHRQVIENFQGELGALLESGVAVWVDSPLEPDEVKVSASGKIVVDPEKKAAKDQAKAAKDARREAIKGFRKAATIAQLKEALAPLIEELGFEIDP